MSGLIKLFFIGYIFFTTAANAESAFFGSSWVAGEMDNNEGAFAVTNDSSGFLGQYCYTDTEECLWLLTNDTVCNDGDKYPVLVNSETVAVDMTMYCIKYGNMLRYAFTDFDAVSKIIQSSENIGIAFPMKSGQFKVSRFQLDGAKSALESMRYKAGKLVDEKHKKDSID